MIGLISSWIVFKNWAIFGLNCLILSFTVLNAFTFDVFWFFVEKNFNFYVGFNWEKKIKE